MPSDETEIARPFLTAEWRTLAMLNCEVDEALLRDYTPAGTELDRHDNVLYVSIVGFLFLNTRVKGIPIPFHRNFEEVNLRFYVRRRGAEGWRRGVVFIKEIAPRRAVATVARRVYNENYVTLPMRHNVRLPSAMDTKGEAEIEWRTHSQWNAIRVEFEGEPVLPRPGSEEEFITEHYWGYTRQRDGGTLEYRVDHPQWPLWHATRAEFGDDIASVYGKEFVEPLAGPPASAFVAVGSEVRVSKGTRIAVD